MLSAALLLPAPVRAQALGAIAGSVTDATGAALPGVSVEATSPALIEGTRAVVTDGQGRYSIVSLVPGTYAVTFTLTGFNVVKHEGVVLNAGFTAPVNAELKVGALEETVTVTGASPTVDVQNVRTQSVLDRETLNTIPNGQSIGSFIALTVGLQSAVANAARDNSGAGGEQGYPTIHGNRGSDTKWIQEGMVISHAQTNGGGNEHFGSAPNLEAIQEVVLTTNGMTAESETIGVQLNYIPKDGANRFSASGRANFANEQFQSNNLTNELVARGATAPSTVKAVYDYGASLGGPLKKDKLWFFTAHRWWGTEVYPSGLYINGAQGQKAPSGLPLYVPDLNQRAVSSEPYRVNTLKLAWQASSKDKVSVYSDSGYSCICAYAANSTAAWESTGSWRTPGKRLEQVTWTRPQSNKLLFEAGWTNLHLQYERPRNAGVGPNDIQITQLSTGFRYNSNGAATMPYNEGDPVPVGQNNARASVSYVTGSHSLKVGGFWLQGYNRDNGSINVLPGFGPVAFVVNDATPQAVPVSLTLLDDPQVFRSDFRNMGFYAQDQWRLNNRWTANLGIRRDMFDGWSPAQDEPATVYVQGFHINRIENTPTWRDLSPRLGVAYDVSADGKTAVKVSMGRAVASAGAALPLANNPATAIATTTSRTWNDANNNFYPDCNPRDPNANGECGPSTNAAFGTPAITTFYAPDVLTANRPYTWQASATLDHELLPNTRVSAGYFRTQLKGQYAVNNQAVTAAAFDPYCVTVPSSSLLPGGGGNQICGLADITAAGRATVPHNTSQTGSDFGTEHQTFNGVDVSFTSRWGHGGIVQGGISMGRSVDDYCYANSNFAITPASSSAANPRNSDFCRVVVPMWAGNGQVKFSGSYPAPFGFELAAVYQNLPGPPKQALVTFLNAQIAPSLGRNLAACAAPTGACSASVNINVLPPNTYFEDRTQQVDLRVAKLVRGPFGRIRLTFDVFNALNASAILIRNNTFGTAGSGWGRPTTIMTGRLMKVGAQFNWN
jgi:hypothetical protein